jgi:hypothetical protein
LAAAHWPAHVGRHALYHDHQIIDCLIEFLLRIGTGQTAHGRDHRRQSSANHRHFLSGTFGQLLHRRIQALARLIHLLGNQPNVPHFLIA